MKIKNLLLIVALLVFGFSMAAQAAKPPMNIQIVGLFKDKAAVKINGKQEILRLGVPSETGVVLVRANSRRAILEVHGVQKEYFLGSDVSTNLTKPESKVVRIPSNRGMYLTPGLINGRSVDFLVDTGATLVAMSRVTADNLQLPYREMGTPMQVSTASELSKAWGLKLASVTVGGITVHQVDATIIDTPHDQQILLGMSFLSRVKFSQEAGIVVLEAKAR